MDKEKIILTQEMKDAYMSIKKRNNTVILGSAGSGKSTFINYLLDNGLKIIKLAPTGVSAYNIGGSTCHKFFGLPPRLIEPNKVPAVKFPAKIEMLMNADAILIDEISMVRADMIDGINHALQKTMVSAEPFGGMTMIFMGDLGQLSPIVGNDAEKQFFNNNYKSEFFFDSTVFQEMENDANVNYFNFTKIFRQKDEEFIGILNEIRFGTAKQHTIDLLNERCYGKPKNDGVVVCSRNNDVATYNSNSMFELDSEDESYRALIDGDFKVEHCNAEYNLILKKGCRVMTLINDLNGEYHNGSIGTYEGKVTNELGEFLKIVLDPEKKGDEPKEVLVAKYRYQNVEQKYSKKNNSMDEEIKGSMVQFPVKLAFAISSHKTQGLTFDKCSIDMGRRGAFAHGQLYVSLSRCRTLEGLRFNRKLNLSDVIVDDRVKDWLEVNSLII